MLYLWSLFYSISPESRHHVLTCFLNGILRIIYLFYLGIFSLKTQLTMPKNLYIMKAEFKKCWSFIDMVTCLMHVFHSSKLIKLPPFLLLCSYINLWISHMKINTKFLLLKHIISHLLLALYHTFFLMTFKI